MRHYRIYRFGEEAYQVRVWRWWWPFWTAPGDNMATKLEYAEAFAKGYAGVSAHCVKSLGPL